MPTSRPRSDFTGEISVLRTLSAFAEKRRASAISRIRRSRIHLVSPSGRDGRKQLQQWFPDTFSSRIIGIPENPGFSVTLTVRRGNTS